MSNYKFGLAVANSFLLKDGSMGTVVVPTDVNWWEGFVPYMIDRYDTPKMEKEAVQKKLLPMFLYWEGEHIFHYSHAERIQKRDTFFREALPANHPIHNIPSAAELSALEREYRTLKHELNVTSDTLLYEENMLELKEKLSKEDDSFRIKMEKKLKLHLYSEENRVELEEKQRELTKKLEPLKEIDFYPIDPFSGYGGDYWMNEVYKNVAFWEGLHKAGTRGLFVLEVGSEHSLSFDGFEYALYDKASCPAWVLLVADLRGESWTLERVYPRVTDLQNLDEDGEYGQDLHFYSKYENTMIAEALANPHRETLTADILHRPNDPWYVY